MSETRADLLNKKFKVNQIRNAVYAYIKYLKTEMGKSKDEITELLKKMGRNIGLTYANYWKPDFKDELDLMREIHRTVFRTAARVRQTDSEISVVSRSCPLCKYRRENIDVSGHNIIIGFIETFFEILSKENPQLPKIKGISEASRIFGDKKCQYKFKIE